MIRKLIGIDIGTQGTKAAVFDHDGRCLATSFIASNLHEAPGGIVEESPDEQYASVLATIADCMKSAAEPEDVSCIAIDGQTAGVIGIGDDGRHVTPYDSWLDTRCAPYIARMSGEAGDEVLAKTGCAPSFNHGPKILWWQHEKPEVYGSIRSFVQPAAYAAMRLCDLGADRAFIDKTYLHFSGFADNEHARWDQDLCRRFGVAVDKLPRIVDSTKIIGSVSAGAARQCGLRPGTPVAAGCGDTSASFLACGCVRDGIAVDVAGTASVFALTSSAFYPDRRSKMLACSRSAVDGLWHSYAYINGGGMNLEWYRKNIASGIRPGAAVAFDELNRLAEEITPADDDPFFIPHLSGRVCPGQPNMRGGWIGANWRHSHAHMYRAVLEGVALEYGIYLCAARALNPRLDPREARVTGGGRHSRVWNQIKADVLGLPVAQVDRSEGAPLGAAIVAGVACGIIPSFESAAQWIRPEDRTNPNAALQPHYRARQLRYEAILDALNPCLSKDVLPDV